MLSTIQTTYFLEGLVDPMGPVGLVGPVYLLNIYHTSNSNMINAVCTVYLAKFSFTVLCTSDLSKT